MIKFEKIAVTLGEKKIKNYKIEKDFGLMKNSIFKKTGIFQRYISNKIQTSEKIAIDCCKKININLLNKVTHIISVTNTPSYSFPSIAHFISSELKLSNKNVFCLGLNSGCSGYVDALAIAYDIIKSNKSSKILLTTSDTYSKFFRNKDKYIRCLFSDGGSATLISYSKKGWVIKKKYSESIPKSQNYLAMNSLNLKERYIKMDGPAIVNFAISKVIPKLKEFTKPSTEAILIHQAGKIVNNLVSNSINKKGKIFMPTNYRNFGNLVSTSIPLVFYQNFKKINLFNEILLCGFGVGLTHSYIKLIRR